MSKPVSIVTSLDVTQSHRVATQVEVLIDGAVVEVLTDALDGDVTLDATAEARGRFSLTITGQPSLIPVSSTSLLAPFGNELRISRGIEYNDRIELVHLGVFRIEKATASGSGEGTALTIDGLDRSGQFIDAAFENADQITFPTNVDAAILGLLQPIAPNLAYDFADVTIPVGGFYDEASDRWSTAQTLATLCGGELFFDRDGVLRLQPIPTPTSGNPVATFAEGADGLLLGVDRDWDRTEVFNRVIVTGESLYTGGPTPRGVRTDDNLYSPTYYYGRFGRKPYWWANSFVNTDTQAGDAAAGILALTVGAPDRVNFGSIVDPARSPGDVVRIERGDLGLAEDHVIDHVQIPLSAEASLSATTRATQVLLGTSEGRPPIGLR